MEKNTINVILEGKVGNSFGCLFYAYHIAKRANKKLAINSVNNINNLASFYDLFSRENKLEHTEYSITELNEVVSKEVPFFLHKGHYVDSGAVKDREVIFHRGMPEDKLLEEIEKYDSICYLDDASSHAMRNPDIMVQSAEELIIEESIVDSVKQFCLKNNFNFETKGIHIRATDWPWKEDCINSAYKKVEELINENPNVKIFVCCDEKDIEDDLISKAPDNIIVNTKNSYVKKAVEGTWRETVDAGDGRKQDYNTLIDVESAREAFIDLLILSRTDIKYRHEHSSFSWFSEIYSKVIL
jgi:hypothetical protein|tara:strand:- start:6186 stop:7082 length:897 start_codon:yes stop_codon:yes gene_type:complete